MNSRGPWTALGLELRKRFHEPFKQPSFVLYFLLALILGAMGVWAALTEAILRDWQDGTHEPLFRAVVTFFSAIGSLACVQVIIVEDGHKSLRALFSLLLIAFLSLAILSVIAYPHNAPFASKLTVVGTGLAVLCLWLVSTDQERFKETTAAEDAIGGPADKEPAGDTEGFAT